VTTLINPAQLNASGSADLDGIVVAMLSAYLLQACKESKTGLLSFVKPETARIFSALLAVAAAAGISTSYSIDGGVLTISGLTAAGIAKFAWLATKQFAMQEFAFRIGIKLPDAVKGAFPLPPGAQPGETSSGATDGQDRKGP
jgi:hypothetical protein